MRKEITSATLEIEDVAALGVIAKREHGGNKSAALRCILRQEFERRGMSVMSARPAPVEGVRHERGA